MRRKNLGKKKSKNFGPKKFHIWHPQVVEYTYKFRGFWAVKVTL